MHNNNNVNNHSEEIIAKENKRLREEAYTRDEKIDTLFNFLINMQHTIMNKTSSIPVLQNLDMIALRTKITEIQENVYELVYKNSRQNYNSTVNENFSGTMKSTNSQMYTLKNFKELSEENEKNR